MPGKSSDERLRQRIKVLENEISAQVKESEVLQKAYDEMKHRLEQRIPEQTEAALQGAKEQYQRLLEDIGDNFLIYSHSLDGILTYAGPGMMSIFGIQRDEAIGKEWGKIITWESRDLELAGENIHNMISGLPHKRMEMSFMHPNGSRRTVFISPHPMKNCEGAVVNIEGILEDITERKQTEKALKELRIHLEQQVDERTEALTKAIDDLKIKDKGLAEAQRIAHLGNWDWNIITNELYWSDEIYRIFGLKPQEFDATYDAFLEFVHPDDREALENAVGKAIKDPDEPYVIEHQIVHKDGSIRIVQERGEVTFDDDGTPTRMVGTVQDITTRKQAEFNYRTLAEFTYDWAYWVAPDGKLNYVSPSCERISGYDAQQFIDTPPLHREIILPEDRKIWDDHLRDARKHLKPMEIQFRIQTKNGDIRWIEHACQPVTFDRGLFMGFRASNRDITLRKEVELNLIKAYEEIKTLKDQLEADQTYLREEIKLEHDHENIIGNSNMMKYVLARVEQIAPTDTTVLIQGETGTGKELIARAIHHASQRKARPLIKVDCASLPSNLIESELFGHEKGAFTHAIEKRMGRFELANGATLFLDEIGELPLDLQPKLLRVLQDGEFERLGSSKTLHTDVRIIAATNRNLEDDVRNKQFRMDLFYRLNVFAISVPPLRDRTEDIGFLVNYMIKNMERKLGKQIRSFPTDILTRLQDYAWPGNIRELENVIERAVINTQGDSLHLGDALDERRSENKEIAAGPIKTLQDMEQEHIRYALKHSNWKIHGEDGAAALLGLNPSTLRGRMRKNGIRRPSYKT